MEDLEPLALSRALRDAARAAREWRRGLRDGASLGRDPFAAHRPLLGQSSYQRVEGLPAGDPLRPYLLRWVHRLADDRINAGVEAELARLWAVERHPLDAPRRGEFTRRELLRAALTARRDEERDAWLEALFERAGPLRETQVRLFERRAEVARRLGLSPTAALGSLSLARPAPKSVASDPTPGRASEECAAHREGAQAALRGAQPLLGEGSATAGLAERWLVETRELASLPASVGEHLARGLALDAPDRFPARLDAAWLARPFGDTPLFRGLAPELGRLPAPLAPASFVRASARLGAGWASAAGPTDQPFVVAEDPYGLPRRSAGALFAGLWLSPAFLTRALGLGRAQQREFLRVISGSLLLATRVAALRVLLAQAALAGARAARDAFERFTPEVAGQVPAAAEGALWRPPLDAEARFLGLLVAAHREAELREEHDEDWFRNPRAAEALRDEARGQGALRAREARELSQAELTRGSASLARSLGAALAGG